MILDPSQIYAKRFTTITVTVFANLTNKQNKQTCKHGPPKTNIHPPGGCMRGDYNPVEILLPGDYPLVRSTG